MTGAPAQPEFQQWELAEIYRLLAPGGTYYGDPPERWDRRTLHAQIRARLTERRGGTYYQVGDAIREADEALAAEKLRGDSR